MLYPWLEPSWRRVAADRRRIPNAWIILGDDGIGRDEFADELARALLCDRPLSDGRACGRCRSCALASSGSHPDLVDLLRFVDPVKYGPPAPKFARDPIARRPSRKAAPKLAPKPGSIAAKAQAKAAAAKSGGFGRAGMALATIDGKPPALTIDAVRAATSGLLLPTSMGGRRALVVNLADNLTVEASNALLKSLEEPPKGAVFLLLSRNLERLLPTVVSRCRVEKLPGPDWGGAMDFLRGKAQSEGRAFDPDAARDFLAFNGGRPLAPDDPAQNAERAALLDWLQRPFPGAAPDLAERCGASAGGPGLAEFCDWLAKWLCDAVAVGAGMGAVFYPGRLEAIRAIASIADPVDLFGLADRVALARRFGSTALSAKMQVESMLIDYLKIVGRL